MGNKDRKWIELAQDLAQGRALIIAFQNIRSVTLLATEYGCFD
jgi:hypothetical protein